MNNRDSFRLKCMRLALDGIASDNQALEWPEGRAFNLEMIRQMRIAFDHYEHRAPEAVNA